MGLSFEVAPIIAPVIWGDLVWCPAVVVILTSEQRERSQGSRTASRLGVKPVPVSEFAKRSTIPAIYLWDIRLGTKCCCPIYAIGAATT
jgi:hypothetical protein